MSGQYQTLNYYNNAIFTTQYNPRQKLFVIDFLEEDNANIVAGICLTWR